MNDTAPNPQAKKVQRPISECTNAELRNFGNTICGLSIPLHADKAKILGLLATVWPHDYIEFIEEEKAVHPPVQTVENEEYVTIIIQQTDDEAGNEPVWVSVNGRGMYIERGKPQRIKRRYYEVLENAVREVGEQQYDAYKRPTHIEFRKVKSYPFTVIPDRAA
jgi:hypothetical protein